MKKINWPKDSDMLHNLRAGDFILLSGTIVTARDQAHKRIVDCVSNNKRLPVALQNKIIYYVGPSPTPLGKIIGACGPTTSSRMDPFVDDFLQLGISAMIGKGARSAQVISLIKKHKSIYFITVGGAGAYLSKKVISIKPIAFDDLGPEAIYEMQVKDFPLFVGIDSLGNTIFNKG